MRLLQDAPELTGYRRFAFLLVIIGLMLGVDSCFGMKTVPKLWPLVISMLGIGFIGIYAKRERREASYLIFGTYFFCFSALALYCNFTSWAILGMLWPLFIAFLGIGFIAAFILGKRFRMLLFAGLILLSTAVVFFFVFSVDSHFWWMTFLLAGVSVFVAERAR